MDAIEKIYLLECKALIATKLNRKAGDDWKQRDLQCLGELIFEETGVLLSLSTLKRIWRGDGQGQPHPATLNALAKFVGYRNWLAFRQNHTASLPHEGKVGKGITVRTGSRNVRLGLMALLLLVFAGFLFLLRSPGSIDNVTSEVVFSGKKVAAEGLPNTVVFDYDLGGAGASRAAIQPTLVCEGRWQISKSHGQHAAVYYKPGLHVASLLLDEKVVRNQSFHIKTDGWLGVVSYGDSEEMPIYIPAKEIQKDGRLYASTRLLKSFRVDTSRTDYAVGFYNVRDFGNLDGGAFTLETKVKNGLAEGGLTCQYVNIMIMCNRGNFNIPLSAFGCVGNLDLELPQRTISGRENDLSGFGCDLSDWNAVCMSVAHGQVQITLNNKRIFGAALDLEPGKIKGMLFQFAGSGAVDFVALYDNRHHLAFVDAFERSHILLSADKPYQSAQ